MNPLDKPPVCIIQPGKDKSEMLAEAVIKGFGGGKIMVAPSLSDIDDSHIPVVIGLHLSTYELMHQIRNESRPFVYMDNGYFSPYKNGGYFRASTNALQWIDRWAVDRVEAEDRFNQHNITIDDWRAEGNHILLALQSPMWFTMMGYNQDAWVKKTVEQFRLYTDREIRIRAKPLKGVKVPPLEEDLKDAWAVASMSSNTLIDAAAMGIAVFPLHLCGATPLGSPHFHLAENPRRPEDRQRVFAELSAAQWTVEEMESGKMWADLKRQYVPEFRPLA